MISPQLESLLQQTQSLTLESIAFLSKHQLDTQTLRQALIDLNGPFLLVVAGEFNSGKSSLLNVLLKGDFLKEGVTPTTDQVNLIQYSPTPTRTQISKELAEIGVPADILKDIKLVDTPGTNAIDAHHQVLTERFLPRADFIFFATSADRPFTMSEALFIDQIRTWGKNIIIVINKMDLLSADEQRQVLEFVKQSATARLGFTPPVFPVSARLAKTNRQASGFVRLEQYVSEVLNKQSAAIKLGNPLGVVHQSLQAAFPAIGAQKHQLELQVKTCKELDTLAERHQERTRKDFAGQLALVMQILDAIETRGTSWLDDHVKLSNIMSLLNSNKLKDSFLQDVVKGAEADIEKGLNQSMAWLARRDKELLEDALYLLKDTEVKEGLTTAIEHNMQGEFDSALRNFNPEEEAQFLKEHIQTALQHTALWEVGAIGIGAIITLAVSRLIDVVGVFTGVVGVVFGLSILPKRKEQAKAKLRDRLDQVKQNIELALSQTLEAELQRNKERFQSLYRSTELKLETQLQSITEQEQQANRMLEQSKSLTTTLGIKL